VEERGVQWTGADQVTRRDHHAVGRTGLELRDEAGHVIHAPGGHAGYAPAACITDANAIGVAAQSQIGAVNVAVKIVEGDHAHLHKLSVLVVVGSLSRGRHDLVIDTAPTDRLIGHVCHTSSVTFIDSDVIGPG
jgi:hypothetical protein